MVNKCAILAGDVDMIYKCSLSQIKMQDVQARLASWLLTSPSEDSSGDPSLT